METPGQGALPLKPYLAEGLSRREAYKREHRIGDLSRQETLRALNILSKQRSKKKL